MGPNRERFNAWLRGEGIEIGALHNPLPVPPWVKVTYVDRMSEVELARQFPEIEGPLVPVSVIATAEDLTPIADASQDFVIANHLLEHLEDPIRGLKEFQRVLKPDGVLYLALPDQRQTFDRDRELTSLEHLLDEHRTGPDANRRDHYTDWAVNVDKRPAPATEQVAQQMEAGYSIHFHVWRADTFLEFFFAARRAHQLDFELVAFAQPDVDDNEFIVILLKSCSDRIRVPPPPPPPPSRAQRWRRRLAATPLGPPVRLLKRRLRAGARA